MEVYQTLYFHTGHLYWKQWHPCMKIAVWKCKTTAGIIQNYMLLTIFGIDLKITATELLVFLIVSNTVSLVAVPMMHQDIIIEYRRV